MRRGVRRAGAKEIAGRAIDLGVTLFDTAEIYGFGRSERILGEALGERRASVFLADHRPRRVPRDGPGPVPPLSQALWQNGPG